MAALLEGRPYTRADLAQTPDDGRRYELIDGVLVVSAAPGLVHQRAASRLLIALSAVAPATFEVLAGPFAVVLADDTELQPDLIVGLRADFTERQIERPALVVERSPSTRLFDTHVKRARFERGSNAAWPAEAAVVVWELTADSGYAEAAKVVGEAELRVERPFPVTVVPADLVR